MFRFFRTLRRRFLSETPPDPKRGARLGRYLLYALGEILLVVVGILIALQVDNWNEERKKQREISRLLLDIEQDLLLNYGLAAKALDFYRLQDSIVKRIAHNQLTRADYESNASLSYFISNWEYYLPVEKNINQFVESEKLVPPEHKSIIDALKRVQSFSSVLEDTWSSLDSNLDENTNLLGGFEWFVKNDSVSTTKRLEYFLHDEDYQIAVLRHWIYTQNYYDKITRYRAQTMAALAIIKQQKDNFSAPEIRGFFQKMGMPAFEEYACGIPGSQLKPLKALRSSELYANLTADTLHFSLTNNKGQAVTEFSIPPSAFRTVPGNEYFGLDGDNTTLAVVSDPDGNCVGTFGALENGYLLIAEKVD